MTTPPTITTIDNASFDEIADRIRRHGTPVPTPRGTAGADWVARNGVHVRRWGAVIGLDADAYRCDGPTMSVFFGRQLLIADTTQGA